MTELASPGQLRASFLRWALVLVPGIVLLGFLMSAWSASGPGNPWFDGLVKPALYPPPQLFGIVWGILYALMGLALAVIMTARGAWGRREAVIAFIVQLLLNLAWSPLFFGAHQITAALFLLVAIDIAVMVTIYFFWRVRPLAAWLMVPYLAWTCSRRCSTGSFCEANPGADGQPAARQVQRFEL